VEEKVIKEVSSIVGESWVMTEMERMRDYLIDETPEPVRPEPSSNSIVVKPKNPEEISEILKYANKDCIPVIPRGGKVKQNPGGRYG
jgi:glycolate oxidase